LFLQLFIFTDLELRSFLLATSIGTNIPETSQTSTTKNTALNKRKALQERTKRIWFEAKITRAQEVIKKCAHQKVIYHFNNLTSYCGAMA